jgi:hypothetical protein
VFVVCLIQSVLYPLEVLSYLHEVDARATLELVEHLFHVNQLVLRLSACADSRTPLCLTVDFHNENILIITQQKCSIIMVLSVVSVTHVTVALIVPTLLTVVGDDLLSMGPQYHTRIVAEH